jgi:hypothetical protein
MKLLTKCTDMTLSCFKIFVWLLRDVLVTSLSEVLKHQQMFRMDTLFSAQTFPKWYADKSIPPSDQ